MISCDSFDVGDIVQQLSLPIDPHISAVQLTDRLADMGANLLVRCISDLHYHLNRCTPQPSGGVTLGIYEEHARIPHLLMPPFSFVADF